MDVLIVVDLLTYVQHRHKREGEFAKQHAEHGHPQRPHIHLVRIEFAGHRAVAAEVTVRPVRAWAQLCVSSARGYGVPAA